MKNIGWFYVLCVVYGAILIKGTEFLVQNGLLQECLSGALLMILVNGIVMGCEAIKLKTDDNTTKKKRTPATARK